LRNPPINHVPKSHIEYANTSKDINTSNSFHKSKYPLNEKNVKTLLSKIYIFTFL
jgi:hypothetical protein